MKTRLLDERVDAFVAACAGRMGGEVRGDRLSRALYATDASNYQVTPLAVVTPRDRNDMAAAMSLAAEYELPVLPRGGGSSLAGQAVGAAVVLDTSKHMHQLIAVDVEARRARVQPGLTLQVLNDRLAAHGLKFGPDPASAVACTVGGMIGNNSTGAHSILYRMTADNLQALDVVLADGSCAQFGPVARPALSRLVEQGGLPGRIYQQVPAIVEAARGALDARRPATWRRCGGYNLHRLLDAEPLNLAELVCGSEGSLAAIVEAELKLVPLPQLTAIVLVACDDQNAALEAVPALLECGPSAIEHIDRYLMQMQRDAGGDYSVGNFIGNDDPEALLLVEFYGESLAELEQKLASLEQTLARQGSSFRSYRFVDQPSQRAVWLMRKAQFGLLMRLRGDLKPLNFIEDVAVPVEQLAAYIRAITQACAELGVQVTMGAHASAGCLHVLPFVNLKRGDDIVKMEQIAQAAADLALGYRGVLSSEHGDGLARSWLNRHVFGEELYAAFRQVKAAFDPQGRLNPGKVVDGPPMTEQLRYGPGYRTTHLSTQFDWSADDGFAGAVETCNGQGFCRKVEGGTMCPSYMVTRDERDSTRGRANALRNALAGRLPAETLFGDEVYGVLDLCVGCKACQSECPSSVDMARMKSEFLYHYHQQHGVNLRTRLFAEMPRISRTLTVAPLLARAANRALAVKPLARLIQRRLGIAVERDLPAFAAQRFSRQSAVLPSQDTSSLAGTGDTVVLYVDTWAEHHSPQVARAAYDLLNAAGYNVVVPEYVCCGRTLISGGMLPQAKLAAERVLARLGDYARQGLPIIGLEPSCILTFRDEYLALSTHPRRGDLARVAVTLEEFVARSAGRFANLLDASTPTPALLHGHCHQKSQVGTRPAHTALVLAGYQVAEVDSGCCGMAGSFGYEAEHYAMSLAMAERVLVPAVQSAAPEATLVAAGFSCRQQIASATGRAALHPAEALVARLKL